MRAMSNDKPRSVYTFLSTLTIGFLSSALVLPAILLWSRCAIAQVTSDRTTNTTVNVNGNNFTIINGIEKGSNLFHSFSNFSVPTGGSASFDLINTPNITTIFSRVTGGNVSNIDGLIRTLNSSNPVSLFLMNPAGIVFGQNASLNIGGSFVGTTANSIKFSDGIDFSATNPGAPPLLTMNVPVGLQMGQNSMGITVQGSGYRITGQGLIARDRSNNPIGLQVNAGNTLALIGGEVNFLGGIAGVDGGGHLEVGSVSDGQVRLNSTLAGWIGDYSAVRQFQDIHLVQQSLLDASGSRGSIQLQGRNISLSEGSAALIQNLGAQSSGGITVNATESLNLIGNNTSDERLRSAIGIKNLGTGQTGDITISAAQLSLQNGGQIGNFTFAPGSGGNITVNVADSINVDGVNPANPVVLSLIGTGTFNSGNGGNLTISSGNLRILNGGNISSLSVGSGQSGTVRVNVADLIEIAGNNSIILAPSALNSGTNGSGNANNVFVNTSRLVIREGGLVGSSTLATGSAGSVTINASGSVDIRGGVSGSSLVSRIASSAEIVELGLERAYGFPAIPSGNSGSLTINTPSLRIDGAFVTVKNDGPGRAGDLQINANSIFIDHQGGITASTASGNGGNVKLNLQDYLLMRHDVLISATATGKGNGGNLSINAPVIVGLENSDIIANAVQGRGGNIDITTQRIIGLAFRNTLTPRTDLTNDITASSEFNVNGIVQINNIGIDLNSGLLELPENITDPSQQITTGCSNNTGSSFVATGRGGIPQNPTQQIESDRTWSDIRDISAYRKTGEVTAQMPEFPEVLVQATSWRRNVQGKIELVADKSHTQVQQLLTCAAVTKI